MLDYANNISLLIHNAENIFKGFQVFMVTVQIMVSLFFWRGVGGVGFMSMCLVKALSPSTLHSSDWPKFPQTLWYNWHIFSLPITSASTWTRFSHPEDRRRTFFWDIRACLYYTVWKPPKWSLIEHFYRQRQRLLISYTILWQKKCWIRMQSHLLSNKMWFDRHNLCT